MITRPDWNPRYDHAPAVRGADVTIGTSRPLRDHAILSYSTSGNLGEPKEVSFSATDWQLSVEQRARYLRRLGVRNGDVVATMISFGPWFSGDNIHDALLHLGTRVLPVGIHPAHRRGAVRLMRHLDVSTIITTPSLARTLAGTPAALSLKQVILIGENATVELKRYLGRQLHTRITSLYAATEAIIGFEDPDDPALYCWDPDYLELSVTGGQGGPVQEGVGELLVTRKFGQATTIHNYRLGDIVELLPAGSRGYPRLRFLGRAGHAFTLATGIEVSRAQLERFLDSLGSPVSRAHFSVHHQEDGTDVVEILLQTSEPVGPIRVRDHFCQISLDIADLFSCGALRILVRSDNTPPGVIRKRKLSFAEAPWQF